MTTRSRRAHRILDVQQQLHRIAQWQLAQLDREITRLRETEALLIGRLGSDDTISALPVTHALDQLRSSASAVARLEPRRQAQAKVVSDCALLEKRAERLVNSAKASDRFSEDKVRNMELLEALAARRHTSLQKG